MFSKVRNAIYSVVNGIDAIPSITDGETRSDEKAPKYPYSRPHFLLFQKDEIQVSADHQIRPIIVPRDISKLPWQSGYAETVNAGKSEWNEDQACVWQNVLVNNSERHIPGAGMPYTYFSLFDGHAGHGAAVAAANQLHEIVHEKLLEVFHYILPPLPSENSPSWSNGSLWFPGALLTREDFIIGALESAMNDMDRIIGEDKKRYAMSGGCTALVALFICGKLYVANAGDSRAVRCKDGVPYPMSNDFTPSTEKKRLQRLAATKPELLMNHFTHLEYTQRLGQAELGRRVIYRDPYMSGWAYKTCQPEDLRVPVVAGEGKRSRLLATIGVTRGLGDHELCSIIDKTPIKPFLSSQAEVQVFDIASADLDANDVLVMGTDGLWDVTDNEKTAIIVHNSLAHFPPSDEARFKYSYVAKHITPVLIVHEESHQIFFFEEMQGDPGARGGCYANVIESFLRHCAVYPSAAQDLVMHSRGKPQGRNWQTAEGGLATIDDISVFVIPLLPYQKEYAAWEAEYDNIARRLTRQTWSSNTTAHPREPVNVSAQVPSVLPSSPPSTPTSVCPSIVVPTRASTIAPPTVCSVLPSPAAASVSVTANSNSSVTTTAIQNPRPTAVEESASKHTSEQVTSGISEKKPELLVTVNSSTNSSSDPNVAFLNSEIESKLLLEAPSSKLVEDGNPSSFSSCDLVDIQLSTGSQLPIELSDDEWDESASAKQEGNNSLL